MNPNLREILAKTKVITLRPFVNPSPGTEPWPQTWEARVLPLCHHGPCVLKLKDFRATILSVRVIFMTLNFFEKEGGLES